jgi:signal transduction histidine kinase
MYESIISACKAIGQFGLPRAIGKLDDDRFLCANDLFLGLIGLQEDEILILPVSEIVTFGSGSSEVRKTGVLSPITVQAPDRRQSFGGQATFSRDGLVLLMIPLYVETNPELEAAVTVGQALERRRLSEYVHHQLGPELMATAFSIEILRTRLEESADPKEAELKQIEGHLNEVFRSISENLLEPARD